MTALKRHLQPDGPQQMEWESEIVDQNIVHLIGVPDDEVGAGTSDVKEDDSIENEDIDVVENEEGLGLKDL